MRTKGCAARFRRSTDTSWEGPRQGPDRPQRLVRQGRIRQMETAIARGCEGDLQGLSSKVRG